MSVSGFSLSVNLVVSNCTCAAQPLPFINEVPSYIHLGAHTLHVYIVNQDVIHPIVCCNAIVKVTLLDVLL